GAGASLRRVRPSRVSGLPAGRLAGAGRLLARRQSEREEDEAGGGGVNRSLGMMAPGNACLLPYILPEGIQAISPSWCSTGRDPERCSPVPAGTRCGTIGGGPAP